MQQKKVNSLRLGLFIFISFLLFVSAILILGQKRNMFQQTIKLSTVFKDVQGLRVGNNVRFTGIDVGTIVGMDIISDTAVLVSFSIDKNVVPYIKKDSRATVGNEGLMGSKIVIIMSGTPGSESVESGDQLPSIESVQFDDIVKEIQNSSEKISEVANNLIEITAKINRGDGIFGKLFTDSELTAEIDRTGRNIELLSRNLNELSVKINNGEGLIGRILMDTTFANRLDITSDNITLISKNLAEFTDALNNGEGIIGQLFSDTTSSEGFLQMSKDMETILKNLADVTEKLNDDNNALHKFIADPSYADSVEVMLNNLNQGIVEVTQASEAVQRSGLVRAFSKNEEKQKRKEERKQQKNAGSAP